MEKKKELARRLLMLFIILAMVLYLSSCNPLKNVSKDKTTTSTKFSDQSVIETTRQGETIVLTAPRTPKDRPKGTTIVTKGEKGATVTTSYDKDGFVDNQVIICPDEQETKRLDIKSESEIKIRQIERKADIDAINARGRWQAIIFIPIGFFFAVAFVLRGVLK